MSGGVATDVKWFIWPVSKPAVSMQMNFGSVQNLEEISQEELILKK
jgi:hypothetical protein